MILGILFWIVFAFGCIHILGAFIRGKREFKKGYREAKVARLMPPEQISYVRKLTEHYARNRRRWIKVGKALHIGKLVRTAERDLADFEALLGRLADAERSARALPVTTAGGLPVH